MSLSADDVTHEAESDATGTLTVWVPPGRYRVEATAPPSVGIARSWRPDVELLDRRGCVVVTVHVDVPSK